MRDTYDPRAYREDPPDGDPDPGPPSGHTTAEARRARKVEPPDAPVTIRTARGEYRLSHRFTTPEARRPYWIELRGPAGELVIDWRCASEADARRVARRLDVQVRDGVIE